MGRTPETVLIDTADWGDANSTGREHTEDLNQDGDGLLVSYRSGAIPVVTLAGPDGEVRLVGAPEIFFVAQRLKQAAWLACRERDGDGKRISRPAHRQLKLRRALCTPRLLGNLP